jgi:hypothetical protein
MKDPAVLFYFQDFLVGTEFMSDTEVGKYIRILCHLADKGSLSKIQLLSICKADNIPDAIMEKLRIDGNGYYYQTRMRIEREKRISYSDSRRENRKVKEIDMIKISNRHDQHMENENENINIDSSSVQVKKEIQEEEKILKTQFEIFRQSYPGTKRGLDVEFLNLTKKHKDWKEVIPNLSGKLNYQKACRDGKQSAGGFVPEWKNLQTWINQRCWDEEIAINNISNGTKKIVGTDAFELRDLASRKLGVPQR